MARPQLRRRNARPGARRRRPALEPLEGRLALSGAAAAVPDVAVLSATTTDSEGVTVTYRVDGAPLGAPLNIAIFRSADGQYSPAADVGLGDQVFAGAELAVGTHTVTVGLAGGLPIDPSHPYVLAVADPLHAIGGVDETNNVGSFRTYVIGAVAHGLEFTPGLPAWVGAMAGSLTQDGYDVTIPFDWSTTSRVAAPGLTAHAGSALANAIASAVSGLQARLHPGDVIDLHLIGHSRGSVVISQAALDLESMERSGLLGPLADGYLKLTFLDPHPARNGPHEWASLSPGPIGLVAASLYHQFQAVANDPQVVVPANARDAEVYYQHTLAPATGELPEHFLAFWGQVPVLGEDGQPLPPGPTVHYCDLTGIANGHSEVYQWYQQAVVPTLSTASAFVCPGYSGPPAPPDGGFAGPPTGSAAALAYEVGVLYPAAVDSRSLAQSFLTQLAAAEAASAQGRRVAAGLRVTGLLLDIAANRDHITPSMRAFLGANLRALI